MHPLCSTIIRRPDLVVDHLSAYAALLTQEAGQASRALVNRALIFAIGVMSGVVFVILSGIALMLGVLQNQFHWILVAVPGVMALCAMGALTWTKKTILSSHFASIKSQFLSDAQALRIASGKETQ